MSIGNLIRQRRQTLGITVTEAAQGICAVTAWYAWEQGTRVPRLRYIQSICDRLQVSVDDLLCAGSPVKNPSIPSRNRSEWVRMDRKKSR